MSHQNGKPATIVHSAGITLRCGARTRAGGICQVRGEPGKARCRTGRGPRKGRARISDGRGALLR
jgi:hypothetical protein